MELFFDPDFSGQGLLCEAESKHCINVLRHKVGDTIQITDGKGRLFTCKLINAHPKRCELELLSVEEQQKTPFSIHLAVAPTKSTDRYEWMIEKAMELGVDEITPLLTDHSERRKLRTDRIERIVVAAMKQSHKAHMPIINELTAFKDFIAKTNAKAGYFAHCQSGEKELLKTAYHVNSDAILAIGPEGDFSDDEIKLARAKGWKEVSLGESRLRTETAGLIACHTIHLMNQ